MDNFKNMEPGIKDTAAFDSANKESKKKESSPVISAKAQTILREREIKAAAGGQA